MHKKIKYKSATQECPIFLPLPVTKSPHQPNGNFRITKALLNKQIAQSPKRRLHFSGVYFDYAVFMLLNKSLSYNFKLNRKA